MMKKSVMKLGKVMESELRYKLEEISFSVPNEHWADLGRLHSYLYLKDYLSKIGRGYTVTTFYADEKPYRREVTIALPQEQMKLLKGMLFFKHTMLQVERWNLKEIPAFC